MTHKRISRPNVNRLSLRRWAAGTSIGRTIAGLLSVTTIVALSLAGVAAPAQATEPGTPGVPQASTVIYDEDFENRPGPEPIVRLTDYVGATGQQYTADAAWLTLCNGWVAAANQPVAPAAQLADCNNSQNSWNSIQQLTYGLGAYAGAADPATNFSVSAFTAGNPGAGAVEFETDTNIPFDGNGRFITFSVDVAAVNCNVSAPLLQFQLIDDEGTAIPAGSAVDGCVGSGTVNAPAIGVTGARAVTVGTTTSNGSALVTGTSVGVRMLNNNASGTGNDHAFDNLRIIDATPQLDKSFSPASVVAGETSTLTLTITNTSELAAKDGWSFLDLLPDGLVVADDTASTTCPAGVVTAPVSSGSIEVTGNLSVGMESCTVTVNVTSPDAGTFTNGPDNITSVGLNPPADAEVEFVEQAPAIAVVKSASPSTEESFIVGQEITYSFLVTNTGNVPLTDVDVEEGPFTGTGVLSAVTCPPAAESLAPEAQVTCTATYTVTQADFDAGEITNSATATGVPPEGEPPVSPPSEITVPSDPAAPALTVEKSASPETLANAGESVTYSFLVTNTGNVTLSGVSIAEGDFTGTGELSDVVCPPAAASLAPEAQVTCTATYAVTQADVDAGSVTNSATATGIPPTGEPPVSPPSETEITFPPAPGITVEKSASPETLAAAGETVTYSFVVTNTGNVTLSDVSVIEGEFTGTGVLSDVVCPPAAASLAPAAQVTCTATYTVTQEDVDTGSVNNTATATGVPPSGEPPVSPPAENEITFPPAPAITVVKSADEAAQNNLVVDQEVTYSFLVTNTGNVTLTDVTVDEGEFTGTGELSPVECPAPAASLAPGSQVICTATYTVTQADVDAGSVTNSATGTGVPPTGEPPVSPPSEVTVPSPPAPALDVVKSASVEKAVTVGQSITYSFLLTNTGNVTLTDAAVVEGTFTGTGQLSAVTCPPAAASLAPGAQVTCTATYTVTQADLTAGSISNVATGTATPPSGDDITSSPSAAKVATPGPALASTGVELFPITVAAALMLLMGGAVFASSMKRRRKQG